MPPVRLVYHLDRQPLQWYQSPAEVPRFPNVPYILDSWIPLQQLWSYPSQQVVSPPEFWSWSWICQAYFCSQAGPSNHMPDVGQTANTVGVDSNATVTHQTPAEAYDVRSRVSVFSTYFNFRPNGPRGTIRRTESSAGRWLRGEPPNLKSSTG